MRTLDKQITMILVVWLAFTFVMMFPAGAGFQLLPSLQIINEDDLVLGPLTKGDLLTLYNLFSSTVAVVLFLWAWYVYRRSRKKTV